MLVGTQAIKPVTSHAKPVSDLCLEAATTPVKYIAFALFFIKLFNHK